MHRPGFPIFRTIFPAAGPVVLGACLVVLFDVVLEARVRSNTDSALRLSVLLPYLGVGSRYVLARACGLSALVLSGVSLGFGLELGFRRAKGRTQSPHLTRAHRELAMASLVLVAAHILLPYTSSVAPYGGWPTALVPFDQPYSFGPRGTIFETFGVVAFYLFLALGPSYYLLRRRRRGWMTLHALTAAAYGLVVFHALFLGSDFVLQGPTRVALIVVQVPLTLLITRRLLAAPRGSASRHRVLAAVTLSLFVLGCACASLWGAGLGALTL